MRSSSGVAQGGTCTNGYDVSNHVVSDVQYWHSAGIGSDRKYNRADNLTGSIPITTKQSLHLPFA